MFFVLDLHQKGPGHRKRVQGSFNLRPKPYAHDKHFWAPQCACLVVSFPTVVYKNLVKKHQNLTSIGQRTRSPFFLCLMQNFKAVAMSMVTAIAFFWAKQAQPSREALAAGC